MGRGSSSSGSCRSLRTRARRDPSVAPTARAVSRLRQDASSARAAHTPSARPPPPPPRRRNNARVLRGRAPIPTTPRGGRTKAFQPRSAAGSRRSRGGGCGPARAQEWLRSGPGSGWSGSRQAEGSPDESIRRRPGHRRAPIPPRERRHPIEAARPAARWPTATATRSPRGPRPVDDARASSHPRTSPGAPSRPQASPTRQPEAPRRA